MSKPFFYYHARELAIDKARPWQLCSSIGAVCGKFSSPQKAQVALDALLKDKELGVLPNNLSKWSKAYLLEDPETTNAEGDQMIGKIKITNPPNDEKGIEHVVHERHPERGVQRKAFPTKEAALSYAKAASAEGIACNYMGRYERDGENLSYLPE